MTQQQHDDEVLLKARLCQNCEGRPIDPQYQDWAMCTECGLQAAADMEEFNQACAEQNRIWDEQTLVAAETAHPQYTPGDDELLDDDDQMALYQDAYDNRPLYKD